MFLVVVVCIGGDDAHFYPYIHHGSKPCRFPTYIINSTVESTLGRLLG